VVRCFFDSGRRWKSYSTPRQGALVHAVGALVGKFSTGLGDSSRPAILLTGYKTYGGVTGINTAMGSTPTTPLSVKSASKLAPGWYTRPSAVEPCSPKTPSRTQRTLVQTTSDRAAKAKPVADMSKRATSDSEEESPRTLSGTSFFNIDNPTTPGMSRGGLLATEEGEDGSDVTAEMAQLESRKRRRAK
jgi:hypothetical protein